MNIYQRFIYVGVGGSGLAIGRELEDMIRKSLCGPDGRALIVPGSTFSEYEPNQIPPFFQSLYVDFDQTALMKQRVVLNPHRRVVEATATFVDAITPSARSYDEAARYLRTSFGDVVQDWLPPSEGQPSVAPLSAGAGQYPTVGRAALFHVLGSHGYNAVFNDLDEPLRRIAGSMGELSAIAGGAAISDITIYLGFSIAGGTGTGLFLDIMHLLAHRSEEVLGSQVTVRIIPLVAMPSTFETSMTGDKLRAANLNGARALIDLQRFIDYQNTGSDAEQVTLTYPDGLSISVRPATTPIAFLFGSASVLDSTELFRSMGATMISQVSTTTVDDESIAAGINQSWLQNLINQARLREPHHSGIGLRPFASALSASLSIPTQHLADALARRFVGNAIAAYEADTLDGLADGEERVTAAVERAGFGELLRSEVLPREPAIPIANAEGKDEVARQLNRLGTLWSNTLAAMELQVGIRIRDISHSIDWERAFLLELETSNPVQAARVLNGHPPSGDEALRGGVRSWVERFGSNRTDPARPLSRLRKKYFRRTRGTDPDVLRVVHRLERWGREKAEIAWGDSWQEQQSKWRLWLRDMDRNLVDFQGQIRLLGEQARSESTTLLAQAGQEGVVIRSVMVSDATVDSLYGELMRSIAERAGELQVDEQSLMSFVLDRGGYSWARFGSDLQRDGFNLDRPWRSLLRHVRGAIENLLIEPTSGTEGGLLPSLATIVADAAAGGARDGAAARISEALTSAIPDGVMPRGAGSPEILVTYPSPTRNPQIENFIERHLTADAALKALVNRDDAALNMQNAPRGDSIIVNASIIAQGLIDVPEGADIVNHWLEAVPKAISTDKVAWRQRTAFTDLTRIARRQDRVEVMQRLLGAMFDGHVDEVSTDAQEAALILEIDNGHEGSTRINLEIQPFLDVSAFGWLPYA